MALVAYRHLMRSARLAFQGDERVLSAATAQIRDGFRAKACLEPTNPEVPMAILHAEEVAVFLRQNVVQGKKDGDAYKLRIHDETERGDNDTIKGPNGTTIKIDGKKCSDS